jgi:hypothetical protein
MPALRAGKGVHFVAEAVEYAGAAAGQGNASLWCCLMCRAKALCGKRSVAAVLIFWLLLDQAKSNKALRRLSCTTCIAATLHL